jgi:hypothetical protein
MSAQGSVVPVSTLESLAQRAGDTNSGDNNEKGKETAFADQANEVVLFGRVMNGIFGE